MRHRQAVVRFSAVIFGLVVLPIALASAADDSVRDRPGDFVINRPASLYAKASADSKILREIRPHTIVHVVEVRDQWYKVHSASGKQDGYVRRSYADPYSSRAGGGAHGRRFRVGVFKLTDPVIVRDSPSMDGRKITSLRAGAEVRIVDKDPSGLWYKVESETGKNPPGWIPTQAAHRSGAVR